MVVYIMEHRQLALQIPDQKKEPDMEFIQIMEYEMDIATAIERSERYLTEAKGQTFVRGMTLCTDKNRPGVVVAMIRFDSYEDAQKNNELEVTKKSGSDWPENLEIKFTDLNVVREISALS
jgi:2-keto-4-pentenoate hydratase/2-oxohepta-3-ene-1,7-dioic acid hydratase in catechol pathway